MKKLFALLIALSMIITVSSVVLAEGTDTESTDSSNSSENSEASEVPFSASADAVFATSNNLGTYNSDGSIDITVSLGEVSVPETVEGISVFMFEIIYDKDMVVPAVSGSGDSDGESFDYTAFIDNAPDNWECFGRINSESGSFELAVWDPAALCPITVTDSLTVTVPFNIKSDAKVDDIVFSFANGEIVNTDLSVTASVEIDGFSIEYALQPDVLSELPSGAIPLDIAGYKHDANNVIYHAENDITVGDYISSYITVENGEDDMNYFAIAIVAPETGRVKYCDTVIGRPQSDKSEVVIPAGHYLIGVNGNNTDEYDDFCEFAAVDSVVTLYNVNPETTGKFDDGVELTNAGFVIVDPTPVLKEDALAVYNYEKAIITVYDTKLTVDSFKAMFENDVTVLDKNGNGLTNGYVSTGMTIDYADGVSIVMIGDVYSDGEIDQYDYLYIRRYCFGTLGLQGVYLMAADVDGNGTVGVLDYLYVKRIYFRTLKLSNLF